MSRNRCRQLHARLDLRSLIACMSGVLTFKLLTILHLFPKLVIHAVSKACYTCGDVCLCVRSFRNTRSVLRKRSPPNPPKPHHPHPRPHHRVRECRRRSPPAPLPRPPSPRVVAVASSRRRTHRHRLPHRTHSAAVAPKVRHRGVLRSRTARGTIRRWHRHRVTRRGKGAVRARLGFRRCTALPHPVVIG